MSQNVKVQDTALQVTLNANGLRPRDVYALFVAVRPVGRVDWLREVKAGAK